MKFIFTIIISLTGYFACSQETVVVDVNTKEPLPFATIITNNAEGFYSNENGYFFIEKEKFQSITVSYLGYKNLELIKTKVNDTIFLTPEAIVLNEVNISKNNNPLQKIGFLKKGKQLASFPLQPKKEMIIYIFPKSEYANSFIEQIEFPLNRVKYYNEKDKLYKNAPAVIRINIYTIENNLPKEKIFSSKPLKFIMSEREKITLDISDEVIQLSEKGLCFGLEMIGRINESGEFIEENSSTRPILTDEQAKEYEAVTYLADLKKENGFYPINDINKKLEKDIKNYKSQDYNLAIGLLIRKSTK